MFEFANVHRLPRGGVDPIVSIYDALRIVIFSMAAPPCDQIIALTLDAESRGRNILIVNNTPDPNALLGIVDMISNSAAGDPHVHGLILASVRPGGGVSYDDLDRWDQADDICAAVGIDLIEWFVLGASIGCPRELCGADARWAA